MRGNRVLRTKADLPDDRRARACPTVTLNNGVEIPQLAFGVFRVPPEETQRAVEDALQAGYRHIDTAAGYRNGAAVGAAIAGSGIPREELFVTIKVPTGEPRLVHDTLQNSRAAMGLDFVDLYLIHRPVASAGLPPEAWKAMEELYAEGLTRAIGVSNFMADHLETLLVEAVVVPAVNQREIRPRFQQQDLAAHSRSLGITVGACNPSGRGADLGDATVRYLAAKYAATPAQIILAWHLGSGTVPIATSSTPGRMTEDLEAASIILRPGEVAAMARIEDEYRTADPACSAIRQM